MEFIATHGTTLLFLAAAFGFFMAWGVGANDVANAMGTSVGAKALTIRQALFIAAIFEFAGAYLAGGEVTATIRSGITEADIFNDRPEDLVIGMMAALLASGMWLLIASVAGWPVSTTHSIVGAIIGFSSVCVSVDAVKWDQVAQIATSWVISPLLAAVASFLLFTSVQRLILDSDDPFERAKRYVPGYMFLVGFILSMLTLTKGLKHVGLHLTAAEGWLYSAAVGVVAAVVGGILLSRVKRDPSLEKEFRYANVERVFAVLMIFTACAMAFAHGSNDVANAVGPLAAIVSVVQSGGVIEEKSAMASWVLLLGAVGIVAGLATYGYKVIGTIGKKITELTPSRGFAAEMGTAATVVLASGAGLPISTTHTLVGAVMGVGLARGIAAINLRVLGQIFASWVITIPAGAVLAIIFFYLLKALI